MNNRTDAIKRNIQLIVRMLGTGFKLRPAGVILYFAGAILEIGAFIGSVYATARLGALLAAFITSGNTEGIWFWLWVDIVAALIIALGHFVMGYAKRLMYFAFVRWSTNSYLAALSRLDIEDFYDEERRNLINKVGSAYSWQIPNLMEMNLDLIYGIMRFLAITMVVAQITWWLVPLIALFLVPTLIAESRMAKLQWFVWDQKGDERHIFWGLDWIIKRARGQMELRSTQATNYMLNKIDSMNNDFYSTQEREFNKASKISLPTRFLEVVGTSIGSIVLLKQLLSRTIPLDRYFFLSGALLRVGGALNAIFMTLSRMQESLLFADSYFSLADFKPKLVDQLRSIDLPIDGQAPTIEFRNVYFTYPGHNQPVFENLNLKVGAGEHVALVGENGAGKTTLIKLLLRFYKPTSGQILINGHDLQELSIESWYNHIATLFQQFNEYPFPIDENIYVGRSTAKPDKKALKEAADFGGVSSFVKRYKHGWDTVLDSSFKNGVEPSGGQWQRVALARAFYRQASVLILDEPTSAIDARAEYDIFNNIFKHFQSKTALIVSHRFSTVRRADRIIVIDRGKIIAEGSHQELMHDKKGMYYDLFTKQAEGYLD